MRAIGRGGLALAHLESALVTSAGSGTACVAATMAGSHHVTGTGVGGGTLVGLLAPLGYAALGPSVLFALAGAAMAAVFGAGLLLLRRGDGQSDLADRAGSRVVP